MAQFNYADYAATVAAAQNKEKNSGVKIGFFKLADGQEALVRFNVSKVDNLTFASIHRVKRTPEDRFAGMSVSCLNPIGHTGECPLCEAVANGDERVQKASKRVYVQLLVSYKDTTTGTWSAAVPVIWERPAGFYKELVTKLNNYGDLTQQLFKVTRTGSSLDTVYSIDYAVPAIFKAEMVPADFSAFEGFNIAKHSYWEKTVEECQEYLKTGKFPEVVRTDSEIKTPATPVEPAATAAAADKAAAAPAAPAPVDTAAVKSADTAADTPAPATSGTGFNIKGFSF